MRLAGQAGADALRGKPLPHEQVERRRRSAIELNLGRNLQPCPCPNGSRPWTDDELALLGTMTDHALASRLSRSVNAVRIMRLKRGGRARPRPADVANRPERRPPLDEGGLRDCPAPQPRRGGRGLARLADDGEGHDQQRGEQGGVDDGPWLRHGLISFGRLRGHGIAGVADFRGRFWGRCPARAPTAFRLQGRSSPG